MGAPVDPARRGYQEVSGVFVKSGYLGGAGGSSECEEIFAQRTRRQNVLALSIGCYVNFDAHASKF